MGTGRRTPTVVRTTSPTIDLLGDEDPVSIEQQFYYLKLMAKPGSKPEPIKMKFVRWAPPTDTQLSVDDEGFLDSQAMRVVRTIGQAFEVCHKIAQDQMQEKQQMEDSESTGNLKAKAIAEEEEEPEKIHRKNSEAATIEEEAEDTGSRGSSPAQPPTGLQMTRHSIYGPRKYSSDASSQGTTIEQGGAIAAAAAAAAAAAVSFANSHQQQQGQPGTSNPSNIPPSTSGAPYGSGMAAGANPGLPGTSTLPHSHTWNPTNYPQGNPQYGPQIGAFPSIQSLDTAAAAAVQQAGYRYYPMPSMMPASASMPYGLSSPVVVSPYATLQLPNAAAIAAASAGVSGGDPGDVAAALHITRSLDQYNQQVIRSQLDQAHQSAQVASCQVQLLRDQLTSETTARLEAQSRTHQLLNSNRELLEHVQSLVSRLQTLETKLTSDIHSPQPAQQQQHYQASTLPTTSSHQQQFTYSPTRPGYGSAGMGQQQQQQQDSRLPGPAPINPQRPYQMQTLAELRAGSLPHRRFQEDSGVRTEPESATEDTTDYSSSDQYEKASAPAPPSKHLPTTMMFCFPIPSNAQSVQLFSIVHAAIYAASCPDSHNVVTSVSQPQPMVAQPLMPRRSSHRPRQSLPHSDAIFAAHASTPATTAICAQPLPPSVPLGGMATTSAQGASPPTRQTSPKPNLPRDEEGDEQGDTPPSKSKKSAAKGIFKEKDVGFSRMSFNTRLNNPGKKADTSLINVPPSSSTINEEDDYPPGFNKDERRRSSDGSRRRSLGGGQARTSISGGGSPARQLDSSGMTEKQRKKEAIAAAAAATSALVQRAPASSSIATAMYPPVKKGGHSSANKPSSDLVKRGGFQALSIELDDPPLIVPAQAALNRYLPLPKLQLLPPPLPYLPLLGQSCT
uniref:Capon-like protein n=1 Tax=Ditylenchus dipsaci TaxID=166011 RepID=A0A915EJA0_9BILA